MSNRLTKGTARAGYFKADNPGSQVTAPGPLIIFSIASTAEVVSTYQIPEHSVLTDVFVKVTTATISTGRLSVGISSAASSSVAAGFLSNINVGTSGTKIATVSTSDGAATYGSLLSALSTTSATVFRTNWAVGTTHSVSSYSSSYRYISYTYTPATGSTGFGCIVYPIFYELGAS